MDKCGTSRNNDNKTQTLQSWQCGMYPLALVDIACVYLTTATLTWELILVLTNQAYTPPIHFVCSYHIQHLSGWEYLSPFFGQKTWCISIKACCHFIVPVIPECYSTCCSVGAWNNGLMPYICWPLAVETLFWHCYLSARPKHNVRTTITYSQSRNQIQFLIKMALSSSDKGRPS